MRSATLFAVLASLVLAACASPRKPDVRLPAAYEAPVGGAPAGSVALDRWWVNFNDPELNGLVDQALAANPDARSAAARLREVRAQRISAILQYTPQGDASFSGRRTHTKQLSGTVANIPGFSNSGVSESYSGAFNVSWEVDVFGRAFAATRAANAEVAAARFDYEGTRAALAAQVADAYFQARGLAIQLADARESARIQRSLYEVTSKRAAIGVAATSDADRVAGDLSQADAQVAALEAQLQVERRALLILTGRIVEPTANIAIAPNVGQPPGMPDVVPGELLARRPDVREARARLASAVGQQDSAALAFLPTLKFTPGLGYSRIIQPGFKSETDNWSWGGSITQPVLAIPRLIMDLKVQKARTEQAVIAYEKAVQTAFSESESALVNLDADKRRVAILTDGEARAARAYRASRMGYDRGLTDLQTTLSVEQSWRATRTQLTSAQVQALRRSVQAYKALGGGWQAQDFPTDRQAR
ncbi:MAG: efflux system protein [Phenylobacterium sp.]|nr:efflux system protein [Phenylobacterium sp.]